MDQPPLRCLFAASEVTGFAKTGGLADVAASLPSALAEKGVDCAVITPLYGCARNGKQKLTSTGITFHIPIGHRDVVGRLWRSTLPEANVPVFLVEQEDYFERDDPALGRGIYQYLTAEGQRQDYPDNCERFTFFARAIVEAMRLLDYWPDVLHANDWQTGLAPVYLREVYGHHADFSAAAKYRRVRSLFTIHNLAFQGVFWHLDLPLTGLPWRLFNMEQLEFYGHLNFLKAGIVFSQAITTVSPTYAREIQTPYFGCGLHHVLAQKQSRLFGIVNGADYRTWNPATDSFLPAHYDDNTVRTGKAKCKQALQKGCGLEDKPDAPLLGVVTRLAAQKGPDLIVALAQTLLEKEDVQLAVLGEGDPLFERQFEALCARFPGQISLTRALDEKLAHLIIAGADMFLMPSQYEPCGLSQLYSLKYGTVPIVRSTGGLADTVCDATATHLAAGTATGFTFLPYTAAAFLDTVERALRLFRLDPAAWLNLQRTGMLQDWSWHRSAAAYENLYRTIREQTL